MEDALSTHEKVWPTLATHALGALPTRLARATDRHLVHCELCRERLEDYTAAVDRLAIVGTSAPELLHMWEGVRDRVRRRAGLHLVVDDSSPSPSPSS